MTEAKTKFSAVVLAGDRRADDPLVLEKAGSCKALLDMDGVPMVERVLDALRASRCVEDMFLSGPREESLRADPRLGVALGRYGVEWRPPGPTPSTSAWQLLSVIPQQRCVLLTTADLPLLRADFIEHFCAGALASGADVAVGLAPYALVREQFPRMKKTILHFSDGDYCGCNLFAFLTPEGRTMADRWRVVEAQRKSPLKLIRLLGGLAVLRYRLGWLSLDKAISMLSRRMGMRLAAVRMPFAEAAVDVDSLDDYRLVEERLLSRRAAEGL